MFSRRVPADLEPNRIAAMRSTLPPPAFDLTVSNPTRCAIPYPPELLAPLAEPASLVYDPHPRGASIARAAVAREYERWGCAVDPDHVVLTASTSEAYAFLFKLLCEPSEGVLVPTPSYPLFEHLARAEGIRALPYHLDFEGGWRLDLDELAHAPEWVCAVVVVHPNNPTGSHVHPDDAAALAVLATRRGWAVIADEVFLDYPLTVGGDAPSSFAATSQALTFTLGGLSKSVGLPQLKLAWTVVSGPSELRAAALERLEFIADTFLSVATPVQLALPSLLTGGAAVRAAILSRCRANLGTLADAVRSHPALEVLPPAGGWSATVRFPAVVSEEDLTLELLTDAGVAVQPGYFFDLPREGMLVLSLLPEPGVFAEGVRRLLTTIATHLST